MYNKELEQMLHSDDFSYRMTAAECGYGLDVLINDENSYIREEVARDHFYERYLSKRSVNTVNALLDGIVDKMNDRFERIERDLNQRLSKQFDGKQLNCFGDPTYKMWVSDDGYVYLCGKLTIVYGIKNEFSDNVFDCVQAIADDVMTGNVYKTTDITYRVTF